MIAFAYVSVPAAIAILIFSAAAAGVQSAKGPFWAIATTVLTGKAAAASVGLINSFGNLGGFVGPYSIGWLATRTDGFAAGVLYLAGAAAAAAALILSAAPRLRRRTPEPITVGA
ncbi:MAG TPA: hypothetical protein VFL57_16305, partial [Bryobacteraceae bacterium]|nr:hypothetical protein [Bryobacteraceae bacterium]